MTLVEQKKNFYECVYPSRPNEWEVDDIFEKMSVLDESDRAALLSHVGAIWPVSHSLCFEYLTDGIKALDLLRAESLGEWVRQILGMYEKKGLLGARHFMADVDRFFLAPERGDGGVAFEEVSARMVHYLRGVSGRSFDFGVAPIPATDTQTIYLPRVLDTFREKEKNTFFYKFLITLQWAHVDSRIFLDVFDSKTTPADLFSSYPEKQLAVDLFAVLQFCRVFRQLELELPGLVRQGRELCKELVEKIQVDSSDREKTDALRSLFLAILSPFKEDTEFGEFLELKSTVGCKKPSQNVVMCMLPTLYAKFSDLPGSYKLGPLSLVFGHFDFKRAGETIRLKREDDKNRFIAFLVAALSQQDKKRNEVPEAGNLPTETEDALLFLIADQEENEEASQKNGFLIENSDVQLSEELQALANEIKNDLGTVPTAYVQAAVGLASGGLNRQEVDSFQEITSEKPNEGFPYDEWDYRRGGYRADWCTLYEKSIRPVRSGFVSATLNKYRVQLNRLRRQFESLRTRHRFVKRRRYGDDIDLDAIVEAEADRRSGLPPSDRLFIRLLRDEREITTLFLVDMSNSTEGWVGVAMKEALVLLAEALEMVGDQYGIYGFSGMRRSKSELFHIKHPEENYGLEVQQRIGAILPQEYTRMGPPIRHLTQKLLKMEGKVRLLIVISDGKPEDYDDYKGQYAIEDTRKALLEARGYGLYPFCITIDKSAHEYLTHMFGRGNYIFVDNIVSLPEKMAEMYRLLTS